MPRLLTGCTSLLLAPLLVLSACSERDGTISPLGGGSAAGTGAPGYAVDDCSVNAQNAWVYAAMQDYYLFYDQVDRNLDPTRFYSPSMTLEAARFRELDPYSYLTDAASSNAVFEEGREFGLGYTLRVVEETVVKVASVQVLGPFALAGVERGDIVVSVNGRDTLSAFRDGRYIPDTVLGSAAAPATSVWSIQPRDGGPARDIDVTSSTYDIRTI